MRGIPPDIYLLPALAKERQHQALAEAQHARQLALLERGRGGKCVAVRLLRAVRVSALPGAFQLGSWRPWLVRVPGALSGKARTRPEVTMDSAHVA